MRRLEPKYPFEIQNPKIVAQRGLKTRVFGTPKRAFHSIPSSTYAFLGGPSKRHETGGPEGVQGDLKIRVFGTSKNAFRLILPSKYAFLAGPFKIRKNDDTEVVQGVPPDEQPAGPNGQGGI